MTKNNRSRRRRGETRRKTAAKKRTLDPSALMLRRVRGYLRVLIRQGGWTDIGAALQVDQRSVQRWWRGERKPGGWHLFRLRLVAELVE
ncbi:MAG: hypothetical protein ACRD3V_11270, partial [Vicinamibacteria bacterium]